MAPIETSKQRKSSEWRPYVSQLGQILAAGINIETGVSIGQTRDAVAVLEGLLGLDLIGYGRGTGCSTKL